MQAEQKNKDITKLDPNMATAGAQNGLLWYDATSLSIVGRAWLDTPTPYTRFSQRAKGVVPEAVWSLASHSAGIYVSFTTNASCIGARWTLTDSNLAMNHMPATGVSGLDLYTLLDDRWQWLGVGRPSVFPFNEAQLAADMTEAFREYRLYLPLYNGVARVEIGIPKEAVLARPPENATHASRPIVIYGTSIVQGGCASRPGMAYPAILGRHLTHHPVINLGFSGSGKMEPEVARFLAEIDASVFVLDALPNLDESQVAERMEPFIRILRRARPQTPIVLVENIIYQNAGLNQVRCKNYAAKNSMHRSVYERLLKEGMDKLWYVPCESLLGDDGEGTVDGVHPTDVGFLRMADAIQPVLIQALQ